MKIGRKIYYDLTTGNIITDTGERQGSVVATTIEQDIATYSALSERNRETFGVIELSFGEHARDFAESNGYQVNLDTKKLEFSYPDPSEPEAPPVYDTPLSEQVEELRIAQAETDSTVLELTELVLLGGM